MKKFITKLAILFSCSLLFAAESFDFTPSFPSIYTAREVGLGNNYIADYSTFFSIFSNPANCGLTGDKFLFPMISADMSGDLAESYDLMRTLTTGSESEIADYISSMDGAKSKLSSTGPLTFGRVKNNFGFAIVNSTYLTSDIAAGTDDSNLVGGEQLLMNFGYAYPIKLPKNTRIAIGLGLKTWTDIQGDYTGNFATAFANIKDNNLSFFPIYASAGFGLDAGITFSIVDVVIISVAWENFFAASVSEKFDTLDSIKTFQFNYSVCTNMPMDDNLSAGLGLKLPLAKVTKNFLTTTNIYAQYSDIITVAMTKPENYFSTLSLGAEIEMFNTITFRWGMNNDSMGGGIGLKAAAIHLDAAIYSTKIGFTPNENGNIGASISFGVYK
ncbi:MAG: hypothetical protein K5839_00205 [Treponemataceae bacterium]|nr:hypothetical protein [Treponemataceae bacterium]